MTMLLAVVVLIAAAVALQGMVIRRFAFRHLTYTCRFSKIGRASCRERV